MLACRGNLHFALSLAPYANVRGPRGGKLSFQSHTQSRRQAAVHSQAVKSAAESTRRELAAILSLVLPVLYLPKLAEAAEQGVKASDYTVPALSAAEYADKISKIRGKAWSDMNELIESGKFTELSNNLVLPPVDDLRQAVLYIPSALLKEGKRQEAIGSRKAYTDYLRELKVLDEVAQKANRFDADEEDVKDSLDRLSKRLDAVISYVR